ncbi:MAG: cadherin-like domain-containing protein [Oscillospiraceae bacterium]|nr:cadherin-like domain-containing protein [Oscillospiraceae bacterium]
MFRARFICLLLCACCLLGLCGGVTAAEVDCDTIYCFTSQDFSQSEDPLLGICITDLPDAHTGTVLLGTRILRAGDILTAEQVAQMTFSPLRTEQDAQAQITYLPIYQDRVERSATMTLSIRGKKDESPVAVDSAIETYKNVPNEGMLNVSDPEGEALTYTLVRSPKRGEVVINQDGTFVYTPKKNKVGVDSFVFTAADPAGNISREATVTIQILKPTSAEQYTDTAGLSCRFEAEWLRNTGLFQGERINDQSCFFPEKTVSRGQFLAMMVKALDIPLQDVGSEQISNSAPNWLKPYLAAALRSGLTAGLPSTETAKFYTDEPITGAEAAVMLQNALDLSITEDALSTYSELEQDGIPTWATAALSVLCSNGISMDAGDPLTRSDAAQILYSASRLAVNAPGISVFRLQQ